MFPRGSPPRGRRLWSRAWQTDLICQGPRARTTQLWHGAKNPTSDVSGKAVTARETLLTEAGEGRLLSPGRFQSRNATSPASASLGFLFQCVSGLSCKWWGPAGDSFRGQIHSQVGLFAHLVLGSASCLSSLVLYFDHL